MRGRKQGGSNRIEFDDEELIRRYSESRNAVRDIAQERGICRTAVYRRLSELGILLRPCGRPPIVTEAQVLKGLHVVAEKRTHPSAIEVATVLGPGFEISHVVYRRLRELAAKGMVKWYWSGGKRGSGHHAFRPMPRI